MLGRWFLVCVANRGQRAPVFRDQRGGWGDVSGGLGQCGDDWSSFLQGKEELGVEKGLFSVGVSALCVIVGEADMAGACVSRRETCTGAVE